MSYEPAVTSELELYAQMIWRRRCAFLVTVVLVMIATAVVTFTGPKIYESSFLLLISGTEKAPKVVKDDSDQSADPIKDFETEVQVLSTLPLVSKAVDSLQLPELDASSVINNLNIRQVERSGILSVTYRDTDPNRLLKVLSSLGKTYVNFSLTRRKSRVTGAIEFIERTLPKAKENLEQRSRELEALRKRYNFVDPGVLGASMAQALSDLDGQQRALYVALRQSQALYQHLKHQLGLEPDQALAMVSLSQDPIYVDLLKEFQEAENKYAIARVRYQDTSPLVQRLKKDRDQFKQLLQNRSKQLLSRSLISIGNKRFNELQIAQVSRMLEVENTLRIQNAQLEAIQVNQQALKNNFRTVPGLQRQYDKLVRQVAISSKSLDTLLTKLEELHIIEAQESAPWQVIQPPSRVGRPVSPNPKLNLAIGFVLALISGFSAAYVLEKLDKRLQNIGAVREIAPIPILGLIPRVDESVLYFDTFTSEKYLFSHANDPSVSKQSSSFREAFQSVLFHLRHIDADVPIKAVGFTSSTYSEGKSTTVKHLGLSAAELGQKVLVVDADLRRPELHSLLGVSNQQGLSNILTTDILWKEVVQETDQPGLSIITAGPIPSNPVALLDSIKMSHLMRQLQQNYDLVLIDLPPIIGLIDPLIVATYLDGLVQLIGLNRVTRDNLKAGLESLSRTRLIGAICNMAQTSEVPTSVYTYESHAEKLGKFGKQLSQAERSHLLQKKNRT